jgi:PPP family 3-phenylpropionic acid transporter
MWRFSLHYFMLFALMATVWPYFPALLRSLGFSDAQVGYLQGLRMLAAVGGPVALAWLSERLGRRRPPITAALGMCILFILPLSGTHSFVAAVPLVMGLGFFMGGVGPLSDALAASELPDPSRQYGKARVWGSVGFVATLFLIRIPELVDERSAMSMVTGMLPAAVIAVGVSCLLPESTPVHEHQPETRAAGHGFSADFWFFIAAAALQWLGMSAYYSFFTLYLHDRLAMSSAAWVWALGTVAELPVLFLGGAVINRLGLRGMAVAAMTAASIRLTIYSNFPTAWVVLPVQVLHGVTFGFLHLAAIETVRRKVPPSRRSLGMGLYMSLSAALPLLVGSSLGGLLVEGAGYATLYAVYAGAPVAGMIILLAGTRGRPGWGAAEPSA